MSKQQQWYYQHDSALGGGGKPVGPMNTAQLKASIRGFDFQRAVINACIILVVLFSVLYAVGLIVFSAVISEGSINAILMAFVTAIISLLVGCLMITSLIFFRNVIDWMIDIEDHAKENRELLARLIKQENEN